jgi:hypothetical protein
MDILWTAVGICIIVGFCFYALAGQWGRVIRQNSAMIRDLFGRVQDLEARFGDSALVPIEQVFILSFRLSEQFWNSTLKLNNTDMAFVRKFGSVVGSVKIEKWRSHFVATITELLPGPAAKWQTRAVDFYPGDSGHDTLLLWELPFAPLAELSPVTSLELILRRSSVELQGRITTAPSAHASGGNGNSPVETEATAIFFHVPLETDLLTQFQSDDPSAGAHESSGNFQSTQILAEQPAWKSFYSYRDDNSGIEWDLRLMDLENKVRWDRWKILDRIDVPAPK